MLDGGGMPLLHGLGTDAVLAHQPRDAMLADAVPLLEQGIPNAGTAVGLTGLLVDAPEWPRAGCGCLAARWLSGRVCHA